MQDLRMNLFPRGSFWWRTISVENKEVTELDDRSRAYEEFWSN